MSFVREPPTLLQTSRSFGVIEVRPGVHEFVGTAMDRITMQVSQHGVATFFRQGCRAAQTVPLSRHRQLSFHLAGAGDVLVVDAYALAGRDIRFTGAGQVNVENVSIRPAGFDGLRVHPAKVVPDIAAVLASCADQATITVNGGTAELIKASWIYATTGRADACLDTDYFNIMARADLGLAYLRYLENGGQALSDFIVRLQPHESGDGLQALSLHDDLLAVLSESWLRSRLQCNAAPEPPELFINKEGLYEVYAGLAGDLVYRPPYLGGHPPYDASHRAALVFDFSKAWSRRDYRRRIARGSLATGSWKGRRDAAGGFNLSRHEGAGIELAFRPVVRPGGPGMEQFPQAMPEPGCVHRYRLKTGSNLAQQAGWALDFSVSTGLNNTGQALDDFRFILSVDLDARPHTSQYVRFELMRPVTFHHPALGDIDVGRAWLAVNDAGKIRLTDEGMLYGGFGDEHSGGAGRYVSQHRLSFDLSFVRRLMAEYAAAQASCGAPQLPSQGPPTFDFLLQAYDGSGALLVQNHVRIELDAATPDAATLDPQRGVK